MSILDEKTFNSYEWEKIAYLIFKGKIKCKLLNLVDNQFYRAILTYNYTKYIAIGVCNEGKPVIKTYKI